MAKKANELTPLMKQYWDIKSLHQDKIVLFRMGDFYELFYDDAIKASPLLGITLTQRNKKSEDQTPMCGFPHHSVAGHINKLLAAGLKVAICDQVEDPSLAKGLVKRAITRILTPGMVYDSDTLDQTKAHYLFSIDDQQISFIDVSTGESFYFKSDSLTEKLKLLEVLPAIEMIAVKNQQSWILENKLNERFVISEFPNDSKLSSADLLVEYIKALANKELLLVLKPFEQKFFSHRLSLSQTTLRHLEVFANYKGEQGGSLYNAINRTKTSSGARLLRQWLSFPLRNKEEIEKRQNQIHQFREHMFELKKTRESLAVMGDIERRLAKIAQPQCHGRDLLSLAQAIQAGLSSLNSCSAFFKNEQQKTLNTAAQISEKTLQIISEEAPITTKQGHIINKGYSAQLDELISLSTNANQLIEKLEAEEKQKTGISSLKVRYNNVFGFYIEVTHLHKDKIPKHYQRKQTLANAERFYTDELIELEKKVLSAQVKRYELEFSIFDELRTEVLSQASELLTLAQLCSELDVISSLAWLSLEESYCRPEILDQKKLLIENSRHPVVEQFTRGHFVANTIDLAAGDCFLITGPNMAGKSTLMRQVALTVILAQMGSYVPATTAKVPLYDAIYTRIGASDQLSEGLSTFMVEMTETSQMLKSATKDSLLILDEVGRGTATFDGMCLAQSILEYILNSIGNHTFFATHYHELTSLEKVFNQVKNYHMKVIDHKNGLIEFLHVLMRGSAGMSYGIKVAELAGLPTEVTKRAQQLLSEVEAVKKSPQVAPTVNQMSLFDRHESEKKELLLNELKKFSVQKSSPLQALNKIAEWQETL